MFKRKLSVLAQLALLGSSTFAMDSGSCPFSKADVMRGFYGDNLDQTVFEDALKDNKVNIGGVQFTIKPSGKSDWRFPELSAIRSTAFSDRFLNSIKLGSWSEDSLNGIDIQCTGSGNKRTLHFTLNPFYATSKTGFEKRLKEKGALEALKIGWPKLTYKFDLEGYWPSSSYQKQQEEERLRKEQEARAEQERLRKEQEFRAEQERLRKAQEEYQRRYEEQERIRKAQEEQKARQEEARKSSSSSSNTGYGSYSHSQPKPQYEYSQPKPQYEYSKPKPQYEYSKPKPQYEYSEPKPQYDQPQYNPEADAQPKSGDVRTNNGKKERWNGSRWVRM